MTEEKRFSTPQPKKVKQGGFSQEGLVLQTTLSATARVQWEEITLAYLGRIEEASSSGPASVRKPREVRVGRMIGALIAGPLGTATYDLLNRKKSSAITSQSGIFILLDLYISGDIHPYRFDSLGTNFKTFLKDEAGYSSELNMFNFVRKISPLISKALDPGIVGFLEKGKNLIPVFSSRDEFNWLSEETYRKCIP